VSNRGTILLSIVAHARAGALQKAWDLFRDANLDIVKDDPAVLTVLGRLLKDEAARAQGSEQRKFFRQAATAYDQAGQITGQTYPLINAATLSLLAGRGTKARALARTILERPDDAAETPYWRAATRAEAHLLLAQIDQARSKLAAAISVAPKAFEDHAATLRQFALILGHFGQDKAWLDDFRPPRTMHFAGSLRLKASDEKRVSNELRQILREEKVGTGFGALAAGADILTAEALLEAGADLHVVLPAPADIFRRISVAAYGTRWARRYDAVLASAASCRVLSTGSVSAFPLTVRLATEIAMGGAVMSARQLQTEAIEFVVIGSRARTGRDPGYSSWIASYWRKTGRRQRLMRVDSIPATAMATGSLSHGSAAKLAAVLRIEFPPLTIPETEHLLRCARAQLSASNSKALVNPVWTGDALIVAYASPDMAADAMVGQLTNAIQQGGRATGHYGLVYPFRNPFDGSRYFVPHPADVLQTMAGLTPEGTCYATEDFIAAMHARGTGHSTEYVGDCCIDGQRSPTRLFSVR